MTETGPAATGLLKEVRVGAETVWGTAATAGGTSQKLRRVTSNVSLRKATYRSNEIQPDRQVHDFRHGTWEVAGTLNGELSPLTYESIFNQLLAGTFTTGVTTTSATITATAAVPGNPGTAAKFVRSAGNFVTDGIKVGDVVRASGFSAGAAANNAVNYRVTGLTQTTNPFDTMSVGPAPQNVSTVVDQANAVEVVAAVAGATAITFTVVGKKLLTPVAGSLNDQSFSLEHWFSDVSQSELYTGCRASRATIRLPATGMGTVDFDIMGKTMQTQTTAYFTSPTAVTTSALTVGVNGLIRVNGHDYAIVTGCDISINANYTREAVVGNQLTPYLFPGIQDVSGTFTVLFVDEVLQTAFLNESEIQAQVMLTLTSAVNSDFISFYLPRLKLTSGMKDDKPGAIVGTYGFQALNQINGGSGTIYDQTTIMIQDSLAA